MSIGPQGRNGTGDKAMLGKMRRFARDSRGATAVEYGLIATLVVVAMIASLQAMAGQTISIWNNIANRVQNPN